MVVLKFGGTSVGSAKNIKKVVEIITNTPQKKVVVLSAVSGTTNTLMQIFKAIEQNKEQESVRSLLT